MRRFAFSRSRARVIAFSSASSSLRAATHSARDTTGGRLMRSPSSRVSPRMTAETPVTHRLLQDPQDQDDDQDDDDQSDDADAGSKRKDFQGQPPLVDVSRGVPRTSAGQTSFASLYFA